MRVLGVDPGLRRVGVALSDEDGRIALPLCTLETRSSRPALDALVGLATEHGAEVIVIGLPLRLDGGESDSTRQARRLAGELGGRVTARVVLWDERLSSAQAQRALRETGSKGRDAKARVDQVAATLILQSYLDAARRSDG